MHHIFIRSSVDEQVGCFHVMAVVNSVSVNFVMCVPLQILFLFFFSGYMPMSGIAESCSSF